MIKRLEELDYHDSSLSSISYDFEDAKFKLIFIEGSSDTEITILFTGVSELNIQGLSEYENIEIYSVDYEFNTHYNSVKIICLLGFGKPSWQVQFKFTSASISRSAIE